MVYAQRTGLIEDIDSFENFGRFIKVCYAGYEVILSSILYGASKYPKQFAY